MKLFWNLENKQVYFQQQQNVKLAEKDRLSDSQLWGSYGQCGAEWLASTLKTP